MLPFGQTVVQTNQINSEQNEKEYLRAGGARARFPGPQKGGGFCPGEKLKKNKLLVLNKSSQKTKKQRRFKVRVEKST